MSTVSGLVNSTSTLVTLDLIRPGVGRHWSEAQLVRVGRWSGALALLVGALFAPIVMRWESIFRYAQDLWAPMAAPVVVVFLAGALWPKATARGANACLWLSILSVPFVLGKAILADYGVRLVPAPLENPMVLAAVFGDLALLMMALSGSGGSAAVRWLTATLAVIVIVCVGVTSASGTVALWALANVGLLLPLLLRRRQSAVNLWDWSMAEEDRQVAWYGRLWLWWTLFAAILFGIYVRFW
jgi:SSS family solute:Na+ symporter